MDSLPFTGEYTTCARAHGVGLNNSVLVGSVVSGAHDNQHASIDHCPSPPPRMLAACSSC
jgi:hypothetical protein